MQLILASASPRRSALLRDAGFPDFRVIPADVEEISANDCKDVRSIAQDNAVLKADAVSRLNPDDLVIGADTVIEFNGKVIGKPRNMEDAKQILRSLSGHTHFVATGVCLRCRNPEINRSFTVRTEVIFKDLTNEDVDCYLAHVPVLDKAGAYGIQEHGDWIIERTNGSFTNIIGLPAEKLTEELNLLLLREKP